MEDVPIEGKSLTDFQLMGLIALLNFITFIETEDSNKNNRGHRLTNHATTDSLKFTKWQGVTK